MKYLHLLFIAIIGMGLMIMGCENTDPLSSESLTDTQTQSNSLAKVAIAEVPVNGTNTIVAADLPQKIWDSHGIHHIRGYRITYKIEGDLVGTATYIQNSSWDAEYNGVIWGEYSMDVECIAGGNLKGTCGTFAGMFRGKITERFITGKGVLHGSGGFEGMRMKSDAEGFLGEPITYSGSILYSNF